MTTVAERHMEGTLMSAPGAAQSVDVRRTHGGSRGFQTCIETRDRAAAEQVLDESYALVLVAPSAAVMPRARWLEVLEDYVIQDYAIDDQIVHEADELAAVLQRVRMRAAVLGEDRSGTFVLSDIWRKRDADGVCGVGTIRPCQRARCPARDPAPYRRETASAGPLPEAPAAID